MFETPKTVKKVEREDIDKFSNWEKNELESGGWMVVSGLGALPQNASRQDRELGISSAWGSMPIFPCPKHSRRHHHLENFGANSMDLL